MIKEKDVILDEHEDELVSTLNEDDIFQSENKKDITIDTTNKSQRSSQESRKFLII